MAKKKTNAPKKRATKKKPDPVGSCFCIMPFGGWFDTYWEDIYSRAIGDANLEPVRGDTIFGRHRVEIVHRIWDRTVEAKVVLADVSELNPNVCYELGLAHAAKKPVVLVGNRSTSLPFDIAGHEVLMYETDDPSWAKSLRDEIGTRLKKAIDDPVQFVPSAFLESSALEISPPEVSDLELRLKRLEEASRGDMRGRNIHHPSKSGFVWEFSTPEGLTYQFGMDGKTVPSAVHSLAKVMKRAGGTELRKNYDYLLEVDGVNAENWEVAREVVIPN